MRTQPGTSLEHWPKRKERAEQARSIVPRRRTRGLARGRSAPVDLPDLRTAVRAAEDRLPQPGMARPLGHAPFQRRPEGESYPLANRRRLTAVPSQHTPRVSVRAEVFGDRRGGAPPTPSRRRPGWFPCPTNGPTRAWWRIVAASQTAHPRMLASSPICT